MENLTDKEKNDLQLIELVMNKYEDKIHETNDEKAYHYYSGVIDGLNHAYKIIMGIKDDYLDGV